jgi:hypothetical protein
VTAPIGVTLLCLLVAVPTIAAVRHLLTPVFRDLDLSGCDCADHPFGAHCERYANEQATVQAGLRGSPQGSGQITEREGKRPASWGQTAGSGCA